MIESRPRTIPSAIHARAEARRKRALADEMGSRYGDPTGARWERKDAAELEDFAADVVRPRAPLKVGAGGEVVPDLKNPRAGIGTVAMVETSPDLVAADASLDRLNLVGGVQATCLAVDMADDLKVRGSLEKSLAHQMASCHALALRFMNKADAQLSQVASFWSTPIQQIASIEASRLGATAAKLLEAHNRAALTLQRLRSGGKQTVIVQHVHVDRGGRAVVAGRIEGGKRKTRSRP